MPLPTDAVVNFGITFLPYLTTLPYLTNPSDIVCGFDSMYRGRPLPITCCHVLVD